MSASKQNHHAGDTNQPQPRQLRAWLDDAVRQYSAQIALETSDERLTYAQLGQRVDALARQLTQAGIQPGDRAAIAADRDAETIIAILAVVQAGAGYVPLDLNYPAERLRAMLEAAQPHVVLGSVQSLAALKSLAGEFPTLQAPATQAQALYGAQPGLTYVLFTSGSTGTPKGVAMGDLPLRHLIEWHAAHRHLGIAARTLQFAPLSFDVHFQEIFSTIACGGTLVLITEHHRRDPALLVRALLDYRIERVFVPYIALQMVADAAQNQHLALQDVVSAGEQLQVTPSIRALFQRHPGVRLHNHYGPTESHVVTAFELEGDASAWPDIPPIGAALPHVEIALRSENGSPDAALTTGELLLGGQTLAQGYLGKPELSAERFQTMPGLAGRWYITGDLVRLDQNGVLTYLGRADQQLKVDGFRIEPGEIELALMAHPAVKDAVVTAPELPDGKQLVAHIVLRDQSIEQSQLGAALRTHLRDRLPEYMVPVRFIALDDLPTTPSGKIDRRALPLPESAASSQGLSAEQLIHATWQELLGLSTIDEHANLFDLGARSLLVMRFIAKLQAHGIQAISVADVYDRPTIAGIVAKIKGGQKPMPRATSAATPRSDAIAIVGMATRTAGADSVEQFWQNLLNGKEGIRHFTPDQLDPSVPESIRSRPNFVAARGAVENVGRFDTAFFGISAREAVLLDPQQRMLLELAWNALEHAAINPEGTQARIGVYAGSANNSYAPAMRAEAPEIIQQAGEFAAMLASEKDYVATRIANRLNLNGPAVSIHTACSTGLVAVAQAWHALASGQCDAALAGGATVIVPQEGGYLHVEGAMESADGHCRPFDAAASGTVFASGGAMVVLKRLEDAQRDGDTVYAVIRGVGINNDGGEKASFTAPSVRGQSAAIRMALDHAGLNARSIGYVEAHGTGTALGDPIEVAALTQAWREDTSDHQYCAIGSVKSNLGHTIAAAGVLGLIKAALAVHHGVIPKTLHYQAPNPQIDFSQTPFRVIAENLNWPANDSPRRAAVSSFGVGGTNAHVVIEQAPEQAHAASLQPVTAPVLLPLSAKSGEALTRRAQQLADYLQRHPQVNLQAVAATLAKGRVAMTHRAAVAVRDVPSAISALRTTLKPRAASNKLRIVYLFPGQGSQHPGMAGQLYHESASFQAALDTCLQEITPRLGIDLLPWLVEAAPSDTDVAAQLAQTRYAQPTLFAMHYALAAWLEALGVQPDAMIGHSIGEYAAACRAGVMTLPDAAAAVIARGAAMFAQPAGAMLAVKADAERVAALLPGTIEIAGLNAPALTVVAGSMPDMARFQEALEGKGIESTALKVSHAFHSAAMEGALPRVQKALQNANLRAPQIPLHSCVSGKLLTPEEATNPAYWAQQVRAPVQFTKAVLAQLEHENTLFVEVGPSQALSALVRQHRTPQGVAPAVVPLLGQAANPGDSALHAVNAAGLLWSHGVHITWPFPPNVRRIALPGYPFAGEHYWFKRRVPQTHSAAQPPDLVPVLPPHQPKPSQATMVQKMSRLPNLQQELMRVVSDVSGVAIDELSATASFTDQGLDSLSLTQATLEIERVFGIKLRFRRLLEDLDSIDKLAVFFDTELPAEKFAPVPQPLPTASAVTQPTADVALVAHSASLPAHSIAPALGGDGLQQVILQQMQIMSQQLALLSGQSFSTTNTAQVTQQTTAATPSISTPTIKPAATAPQENAAQPSSKALVEKPFGASARITLDVKQELTAQQRNWLSDFINRYNARSGKSKSFSQKNRKLMADPRVVTGFNPLWKDLVYPIVADKSKGAYVWDLDGNQYIDLLSCFGANFLGYQPDEVVTAMIDQLHKGIEVGPQHPLSAEVAQLISEFTGMERVAFCNTGSEAVMGAMRIARTVTGRKTIAIFTNSYHGIFDEVIVRGTKQLRSLSAAPGILANAVENILVLDWASDDSLRILRERAHELAAIMTEPVQNKYPTLQPREFLHSLRSIADSAGCALIFDEVVTGFRIAPGGAQDFYGVRADIATYGKIIGGGLPFAAIGGSSKWLDALDGGMWQYGDDSYPEAGVTYFAGTFVRHPLALAAARASLLHLKVGGQALYATINTRTQHLIDKLNAAFAIRSAPVKAVHCASLWRLSWDEDQKFISLFYYLARYHGLHLYEQFGHFVTEAMGDVELDKIFSVFTQALDELMALGLITPKPGMPPPSPRVQTEITAAPLSPGQTERWLAANFDSNARKALNESFCLSLKGKIDTQALKAAVHDVIQRHDAFWIVFDKDEPVQRLMRDASATEVPVVDLTNEKDSLSALRAYCDAQNSCEFDLSVAPLAKFSVLRVDQDHFVLHVVVSHLIFDGWATPVFLADLATAYRARGFSSVPQWLPAESSLVFGAAEQTRWESSTAKESLSYWCDQLREPPSPLVLGDLQPPATRLYSGSTLHHNYGAEAVIALRKTASENRATLFQVLFGAVAKTIQRLTSRNDFVVSIPFASQSLARHESLIADGVLDLPVRLQLPDNTSPQDVILQARNKVMDALEHPLATQGSIARALSIPSTGNRPPLTGVYFNLNPRLRTAGFEPLIADFQEGTKLGLLSEVIFNFYESPSELSVDLHYSTEFFSADAARRLLDELSATILAFSGHAPFVLAPPAQAEKKDLSAIAVKNAGGTLSPRDLELLQRWNDTSTEYEQGLRLGDLIRRTVVGQPDAIAVRFEGRSVTYAELDRMAWSLAHHLRNLGVKPGDLVGVCFDRSVELVISLVGVVYSGGAYVPLDPDYPAQRLTHMCEDAALRAVVSRQSELTRVASAIPAGTQVVQLTDELLRAPAQSGDIVGSESDPAYVIFTSGSTGRPKGAINSHRGVVNWLLWMQQTYGLSPQDRIVQKTPYSFDVSLREFFWPLLVGAVIVVARPGGHREANYLVSLVESEKVTVIHFVPSMLQIFLDEPDLNRCKTLQLTICSGEALPIGTVDQFFAALPNVRLVNLYGPTEAAVEVTYWECKPGDPRRIVPIGFPVANTRMYVLDEKLRLLPVGASGDLYISGVQVGIGYANRPELTRERFLIDPFIPGGRMYKTGDIARWLDDGALEYLGRSDHQVKIRGFRIELGEIEARLMEHESIARCVVVAHDFGGGDTRLVAYFVAKDKQPSAAALKTHLASDLPEHMLPAHYVALQEIPLLSNGKIDRKALPEPQDTGEHTTTAAPPRTELEAQVAAIMAEMLKLKTISVDDNFFALGGHSLIAAKVISQLNKRLGTQLTLRAVFESPTAARLAAAIEAYRQGAGPVVQRAPIVHRADQKRAPLTLMQERIRFIEEMQPGRVVYNTPSAHRLTGQMNLEAFDKAFKAMIERQPALRTVVVEAQEGYVQEIRPVEFSLLPLEDLSRLPAQQRESVLVQRMDALVAQPFLLEQAPLFRAKLFKLDKEEHVLFFMTHHIVWDGWSFDVLYAEMSALYESYAQGQTPTVTPLALTYADFAHWHKDWLQSQELKDQVAAWKKHFESAPAPALIHGDFPRELAASGAGSTEWVEIQPTTAQKMHELAQRTGSTLSMVALSVYAAMMANWLGAPCPSIGIPVRGRAVAELEPIMGFFNNMLPVRLPVDGKLTCVEWIAKVRTLLVDVFGSQEAPFELLARAVNAGKTGGAPLYQAMFSFQDARARQTRWGNLEHQRVPLRQRGVTEDINLWMVEIPTGIESGIQYNAQLFLPETIRALGHRFSALLDALVSNPEQKVQELIADSLPSSGTLESLKGTQQFAVADLAANLNIQAAEHFSSPAIVYSGQMLTFGQLRDYVARIGDALTQDPLCEHVVVAHASPVARVLGAFAALGANRKVVVIRPHELLSLIERFGVDNQGQAIVLADVTPDFPLPQRWRFLGGGTVFNELNTVFTQALPNPSTTQPTHYSAAIERDLLNQILAGFSNHVRLLRSDAVTFSASCDPVMQVFLAACAWAQGTRVVIAQNNTSATQDVLNQLQSGLIYAQADVYQALVKQAGKRASDFVILADVEDMRVPDINQLLAAGYTVYNIYHSKLVGLPIAMGMVSQPQDAMTFGHALRNDLLSIRSDTGQLLPANMIGGLKIQLASGAVLNEPILVRQRSDGVLQFIEKNAVHSHAAMFHTRGGPSIAPNKPHMQAQAVQAPPPRPIAAERPIESAPRVPTGQLMIEVWKEVLGVQSVTSQDNFFELGGSSLSAMQAAEAVEKRLGRRISPRRYVFETLGQLAAAYDGVSDTQLSSSSPQASVEPVVAAAVKERSLAKRFKRLVGLT
jgi:amino acid adenylation domain-containing protein